MEFTLYLIAGILALLAYIRWGQKRGWARILFFIGLLIVIGCAIAFGLYVYAMGQANWSL